MPDDTIWPPKPDLPDPLTEYDGVIAAKLAALSETNTGPSRILLIKALRDEEGMELQQAFALSKSYCDRHDVLVRPKTLSAMAWLGCLVPLLMFGLVIFNFCLAFQREAILRLPHHHAAFLAFHKEERIVFYILLVLFVLNAITIAPHLRRHLKK